MFHTRVTAQKRIGPHNLDVISVLVGSLLGDCYASKRSPGGDLPFGRSVEGTRLVYKQSIVHKVKQKLPRQRQKSLYVTIRRRK